VYLWEPERCLEQRFNERFSAVNKLTGFRGDKMTDTEIAEFFKDGVPRNWRKLLRQQGIDPSNLTRQDIWDFQNPMKLTCRLCGDPCPERQTNIGRLTTCGKYACFVESRKEKEERTCMIKYGVRKATMSPEVMERSRQRNQEKYGVDFPLQLQSVQDKRAETNLARYGCKTPAQSESKKQSSQKARRETMEETKRWLTSQHVQTFADYRRLVGRLTKQNMHLVPGYDPEKHGPCRLTEDNWQIDHKFSVYRGWLEYVSPEHIAHPVNLAFIHWRENRSKSAKCDLTKEELLALIEAY
jgi:hypothetical protein